MSSKIESTMDCVTVANGIMQDIVDIDLMERMLSTDLSSADLFKIDCAILSTLRSTTDFSRDLLHQLENGKFESITSRPPRTFDAEIAAIQQEAVMDITLPLQDMFDEMSNIISEAFTK